MEEVTGKLIGSKMDGRHGITLIALMITIIVLLILAGVTLNLTLRRKRNI